MLRAGPLEMSIVSPAVTDFPEGVITSMLMFGLTSLKTSAAISEPDMTQSSLAIILPHAIALSLIKN